MSDNVTTVRINVEGGAECEHRWTIANAIACHDFPGMPGLAELSEDIQFEQVDEFVHFSGTGPQPPRPRQFHSRRAHSFLCVFKKRRIKEAL